MRLHRRGSALVDVLLGLVLTGIALAIIHSGQIATRAEVDALELRTRALLRAQEILELASVDLRAGPSTFQSTRALPDGMTARIDVRPHAAYPAMRQVTISVRYLAGKHVRHAELVRLMRPGVPS